MREIALRVHVTADLTLDHVVPLAVQIRSAYSDNELATRCRSCNSSKG
jgi:5-methylcytosine-specific restriction endonuclease McrA